MSEPQDLQELFNQENLAQLFPPQKADQFFDALYGDASEGAYDINLVFVERNNSNLVFELRLSQRPDRCLACNLTFGLPQVFSRHPVLNLKGLVSQIAERLGMDSKRISWQLGRTRVITDELHAVPLIISLA